MGDRIPLRHPSQSSASPFADLARSYPRPTVLNSGEKGEREGHPTWRGKKFEFSNVEFDLQSANIKVRRVPLGTGTGRARAFLRTGTRNGERCLPRLVH